MAQKRFTCTLTKTDEPVCQSCARVTIADSEGATARGCPRHAVATLNGITGAHVHWMDSKALNEWERKALEMSEERSKPGQLRPRPLMTALHEGLLDRYFVAHSEGEGVRSIVVADLRAVRAKLGQARAHARRFDETGQEIFNRRPFELVGGDEEAWFAIRWKQNGEYPDFEPLSLIFGDILYNLRASLDYLARQLVLANGEQPSRQTSFPCVKESANWNSAINSQLRGIAPRWISEIERLQPFDSSHTGSPETHPLALLDEANNVNKHRLLPIALVTPRKVAYEISGVPPDVTRKEYMAAERVSDGALYARFTFDRPITVTITLDPNPVFRIRFSDITDFDWYNWDLVKWVEDSIRIFEPAFS